MRSIYPIILVGRVLLGLVWGASLVVGGFYLLGDPPGPPADAASLRWLGGASVAAGTVIFMMVSADRVFSLARPTPIYLIEALLALGAIACLVGFSLLWFGGTS